MALFRAICLSKYFHSFKFDTMNLSCVVRCVENFEEISLHTQNDNANENNESDVMWSRGGKFLTFVQTFSFSAFYFLLQTFIVDYLKMPRIFLSSPATSLICFFFIAEYLHGIRAVKLRK